MSTSGPGTRRSRIRTPTSAMHTLSSTRSTARVRGNRALAMGMCHYWEIKMMSPVSGTDMQVGVGTDQVNLYSHQYSFGSTIGLDEHSWGYSYRGVVLHRGRSFFFGKKYTQGSIVGVLLNLRRGTMDLYINRVPQGQAFHDLPTDGSVKLYPMICSTAAKSQMKLLNAVSFRENLQYHAMKVIYRQPQLLAELQTYPSFQAIVKRFWFLRQDDRKYNTDREDRISKRQQQPEILENAVLLKNLGEGSSKAATDETDYEVTDDVYENIEISHKAKEISSNSSDEDVDMDLYEFFCNHRM
ncbi:uncharacterized protein LOC132255728 isoform X3 [Phlebotomus argentipes]|uniref:uncharacterized protein LOC132255728 isoform X3 n=1 Tax=Phlebotomus argentipes TaxID=94469 RepID=UPI002892FA34|nr:uncharacterized protein LOC132255728 isoform X3 [Phlebotomus argentipes]